MPILIGILFGLLAWVVVRLLLMGIYTVDQNERAVKIRFGRAVRPPGGKTTLDDPIAEPLTPEEKTRYVYPQVSVIQPGGPYFKMPWEKIRKVSIATMTVNMALDPENATVNENGTRLEAVTKDQLNTGLTGQIRYRISEANLYAFLFGIKKPFVHRSRSTAARNGLAATTRFGSRWNMPRCDQKSWRDRGAILVSLRSRFSIPMCVT